MTTDIYTGNSIVEETEEHILLDALVLQREMVGSRMKGTQDTARRLRRGTGREGHERRVPAARYHGSHGRAVAGVAPALRRSGEHRRRFDGLPRAVRAPVRAAGAAGVGRSLPARAARR